MTDASTVRSVVRHLNKIVRHAIYVEEILLPLIADMRSSPAKLEWEEILATTNLIKRIWERMACDK